jgi:hypothetical protein
MSIDNYTWVPAGARHTYKSDRGRTWTTCKSPAELSDNHKSRHQVYIAHESLDEQYFFDDADDARWFWIEGYKGSLFLDQDEKTVIPYSRMALWIDGAEVDSRCHEPKEKPSIQTAEEPVATSSDLVHEDEDGVWDLE